jgi:predicted membrane GTPase involved in stress response
MLLYLLGAREGEMEQEMNVVDGVLLEVDLWEGVSLRTEEMLVRAVGQRVAVVAFIGGMEKIKGAEEAIERINEIIGRLNEVAKAFGGATTKELSI